MQPSGKERAPIAVAMTLSLSPNQIVAILLEELIKNGYPIAIGIVAIKRIPNLSLTSITVLSHAPPIVHNAPVIKHILIPKRSSIFITTKFIGMNIIKNMSTHRVTIIDGHPKIFYKTLDIPENPTIQNPLDINAALKEMIIYHL